MVGRRSAVFAAGAEGRIELRLRHARLHEPGFPQSALLIRPTRAASADRECLVQAECCGALGQLGTAGLWAPGALRYLDPGRAPGPCEGPD